MHMLLDERMGAGKRAYVAVEVDERRVAVGFGVVDDALDASVFFGVLPCVLNGGAFVY
jgi:hypothetical protein